MRNRQEIRSYLLVQGRCVEMRSPGATLLLEELSGCLGELLASAAREGRDLNEGERELLASVESLSAALFTYREHRAALALGMKPSEFDRLAGIVNEAHGN